MDVMGMTSILALYLLLIAAVIMDFSCMKISNRLILAGLLLSILSRIPYGAVQVVRALPNIFFPVVCLFIFYLLGAIGAGDIKLLSVIGGFVSFSFLCSCVRWSFLIGAILAAGYLIKRGRLFSGILNGISWLKELLRWCLTRPEIVSENSVRSALEEKGMEFVKITSRSGVCEDKLHFSLAVLIGFSITGFGRGWIL